MLIIDLFTHLPISFITQESVCVCVCLFVYECALCCSLCVIDSIEIFGIYLFLFDILVFWSDESTLFQPDGTIFYSRS